MKSEQKLPLVLIVDDSEFNRELLKEIIQDSFRIVEAANGASGIEIMEQRKSELACVLLDLTMAKMNGFEVMQIMNEREWIKTLPVIIISAEFSQESIRKAYTLGATVHKQMHENERLIKCIIDLGPKLKTRLREEVQAKINFYLMKWLLLYKMEENI